MDVKFMNKLEYFKQILGYLENPNKDSIDLSLDNVHHKGLFSLVIDGTEHGSLKRIFIATKKINPYNIQLHTHRYPIKLTALSGTVKQHEATVDNKYRDITIPQFEYRSPLNGGNGLSYTEDVGIIIRDFNIPIGSSIEMTTSDIHTISCKKDSIWIVEEGGLMGSDHSLVYGIPFKVDGLYTKRKEFQVSDNINIVKKILKNLIKNYECI